MKTADQTVGSISFTAGTSTTITSSGQHTLTLDNLADAATIEVDGTHSIGVPVILAGDAIVSGQGTLDFTGGISGAHTLTVDGGTVNAASIQVDTLNIGNAAPAAAVPEPSAAALLCMGFAVLFAAGWRNSKQTIHGN